MFCTHCCTAVYSFEYSLPAVSRPYDLGFFLGWNNHEIILTAFALDVVDHSVVRSNVELVVTTRGACPRIKEIAFLLE